MTALAQERMSRVEKWKYRQFTLASGNKGWKHGIAVGDASTGKVEPGHAETDLLNIGRFAETIDAAAGDKLVNIEFPEEKTVEWFANGTAGDAVAAADVFGICYILDDQTVSILPTGKSVAGRIWAVDSVMGVAVERLTTGVPSLLGVELAVAVAPAYVANDSIIPADPASGAVYDVPTTAAASTVTLPASAAPGTLLAFSADGTKNGHTVQYRDATGPVNLTTALTASKRHLVICVFLGGKWAANAYIAP